MEIIQEFKDEFRFLSNFYPSSIVLDGICYPTAEHAYQAYKTLDKNKRQGFSYIETPGLAKKAGRALEIRKDWDNVKLAIMFRIVFEKFKQNPRLVEMLLSTENAWLVEGNNWGDSYWGKSFKTQNGENWLGRILMLVRSVLQLSK